MTQGNFDLLVIGAGPGGYTAAIRGAQLGLNVACIDKETALGGTCLRVGCIPSKALLEASERFVSTKKSLKRFGVRVSGVEMDLAAMMKHKERTVSTLTQGVAGLLKKNSVTRIEGSARLLGSGRVSVEGKDAGEYHGDSILIATGSSVASLPGVALDGERVGGSTEALAYDSVPEHLVVIGAGVIGLELGSVWARLGAKVTVFEYAGRILPGMDLEIAKLAQRFLKKQGMKFHLGAKVTGVQKSRKGVMVEVEGMEPTACDKVLVAVGRMPNTEGLGVEEAGLVLNSRGMIEVDPHTFETNLKGVYAIGDVIQGPMLAHKAEEEGIACVERLVTGYGHVNYGVIPGIVYTHPEIAVVGRSEESLQEEGIPYRKGSFPFSANGRARSMADMEGLVKILAHEHTDRILGAHIVGPRAGDLIGEIVMAMEFGASAEDIARTCHAHPSLGEAVKEAALAVANRSLNS